MTDLFSRKYTVEIILKANGVSKYERKNSEFDGLSGKGKNENFGNSFQVVAKRLVK